MRKLTKKKLDAYLKNPYVCPFCGGHDLGGIGHVDVSYRHAYQEVLCPDCKEKWTDEYALISIVDQPGEPIDPQKLYDDIDKECLPDTDTVKMSEVKKAIERNIGIKVEV